MSFDDKPDQHKSLEEWTAKFGGDPGVDPFADERPKRGFDYELDVAYYGRVDRVQTVKSSKGDEQLRLFMTLKKHGTDDAETLATDLLHITLPYQATDANMGPDTRASVLRVRFNLLRALYSAAFPSEFAPYDRTMADPKTQKPIYLDFQGQPLTNGRYEARQGEIAERSMETLDKLKTMIANGGGEVEELQGSHLWIHKKPNNKNPKYPHLALYSQQPRKIPAYNGGEEETPF